MELFFSLLDIFSMEKPSIIGLQLYVKYQLCFLILTWYTTTKLFLKMIQ